jgi:hypothetical protein
MPMISEELNTLLYWIEEREDILRKKDQGAPKPWTDDPILRSFKFCNVHRENDRVTRWFKSNWRSEQYWGERNFIPAIMFGRTINWPPTLEEVGFPYVWEPRKVMEKMDAIQARGQKVYTGAYMITAGPTGVRKNDWVTTNACYYFDHPPIIDGSSIRVAWETIISNQYPCVGPFIAGQIIADLKHTPVLRDANDWGTWAALGPGSARGLNRIYGRKLTVMISQGQGLREMRDVFTELGLGGKMCLQDLQNCLCEFDKYRRVQLGQGKPRSSYSGV